MRRRRCSASVWTCPLLRPVAEVPAPSAVFASKARNAPLRPRSQFLCNICVLAQGWLVILGWRQVDGKMKMRRAGMLTPFKLTPPVTDDSAKAIRPQEQKSRPGLPPKPPPSEVPQLRPTPPPARSEGLFVFSLQPLALKYGIIKCYI